MSEERRQIPRESDYDPARLLTYASLFYVAVLIIFVAVIIGWQIYKSGEANTESWAALTGILGWATSQASIIISNRFGNTQQSAKKDEVIARQAATADVIAKTASSALGSGVAEGGTLNAESVDVKTSGDVNVVKEPKP